MTLDPRAERTFFAVCSLLFVVTTAVTIVWCRSMTAMGGMRMPGGWTMSMAWMQMPGQTWLGWRRVVSWHVDRDDGRDDAAMLAPNGPALPSGC